ncbi:MAG: ATP-binding protein [Blastocatellia bacterium]
MLKMIVPTNAFIHSAHHFFSLNSPFTGRRTKAVIELDSRWMHFDPMSLSMIAAWGGWCQRQGLKIEVKNPGRRANYAARMKLFQHLGVDYEPGISEHEEAGRFMPLSQVRNQHQLTAVIANISALLHLDRDPDSLAAVQYCVSELLRNVLEHSGSGEGAFVCAHRYTKTTPHRVTIAVADCGRGIAEHLGHAHPDAFYSDQIALGLAMRPGITGALKGLYGIPENAGAGLFITRCIAKGTGGYFLLVSGDAGYRLRRARTADDESALYIDPFDEPRHDLWQFPSKWQGTIVALEICTEKIADFQEFFQWVRQRMPERISSARKIRFT